MKIKYHHKEDVAKNSKNRKIVLFGSGNIAVKTIRILNKKKLAFTADNAENMWNTEDKNIKLKILNPSILKKRKKDFFVIICTTSFKEVASQLSSYGYEIEKDFIVSPVLNDLRIIDDLESVENRIIFSSGSPTSNNNLYGGGIYLLNISQDKWKYIKKISGNCYGITKYKKNFISIDQSRGIFEFDKNFKILRSKKLPKYSRAHGVSYSDDRKEFYVVCSYLDAVLVLNEKFSLKKKISISEKFEINKSSSHHCNDCTYFNNHLYVSMFSETGNWKQDVYDGCLLEIDLVNNKVRKPIVKNLWMPHNPKIIDGSFYVNDSLRGYLLGNNFNIIGSFPAFTRGLAHDGKYFYIGQSKNRNYSKNIGLSNNIAIDAGITVFDEKTKVSRFLQFSPKLSEIHAIEILED